MKTKLLLIYGYLIPVLASLLIGISPWLTGFISYDEISAYFANNSQLLFGFLALIVAIVFPFQSSVITEDNPHVLAILEATKVRVVFIRALIFQAALILSLALLILILCTRKEPSPLYGFLELFSLSMIVFESFALISNGRDYGSMREKIISATNKADQKNLSRKSNI